MKRKASHASVFGMCLMAAAPSNAQSPSCRVGDGVVRLSGLSEASGLAASRKTPGVLWSHNDTGEPVVFALSSTGTILGRVRVTGAQATDWEDVAVGDCPQGACLYIADIGDNGLTRRGVTIYRVPEPSAGDAQTAKAEAMHATYPNGAHDAEAMIVLPRGEILIVTKGDGGPVELYRFPSAFKDGATVALQHVAALNNANGKSDVNGENEAKGKSEGKGKHDGKGKDDGKSKNGKGEKGPDRKGSAQNGPEKNGSAARGSRITGGAASSDGRWIVLRTHNALMFYDAREFTSGKIREVSRFDVGSLAEPQGEGVAFGAKGEMWLSGEGGGKGKAGTLARLSCDLP